MKGIYPPMIYILLFGVGIFMFITFQAFTDDFVAVKNLELEQIQAEKLCHFVKSLEGKEGEMEIDLADLRIETQQLRLIGFSVHPCDVGFDSSGSCSGKCKIILNGDSVVFVSI